MVTSGRGSPAPLGGGVERGMSSGTDGVAGAASGQ